MPGYWPDTSRTWTNPDNAVRTVIPGLEELNRKDRQQRSGATSMADPDITMLTRKYDQARRYKISLEREWLITAAFLRGQHYLVWNARMQRFDQPVSRERWRARAIINFIQPWYLRTLSKLTTGDPTWNVSPVSADYVEINKAKAAEKYLTYAWNQFGMRMKNQDAVGWMLETGLGIFKLAWDKADDDHRIDLISPYEFLVDPGCKDPDLETAQWVMQTTFIPRRELVRHPDYGHLAERLPATTPSATIYQQWRARPVVGPEGYWLQDMTQFEAHQPDEEYIHMWEYWEKPSKNWPQGRVIVGTPDAILDRRPNPYHHGRFPFVVLHDIRVPGQFWPLNQMSNLTPIQRVYNRTRSQIMEIRNLVVQPRIMWPVTGHVDQGEITNEPGRIIKYYPGFNGEKPEVMNIEIPGSLFSDLALSQNEFAEVGTQHDVSRGRPVPNMQSGRGVALLQAADDTPWGVRAVTIETALSRLGWMLLSNTAQMYTRPRLLSIVGKTGSVEAMIFKGTDIPLVNNRPPLVDVVMGAAWPRDRAAMRQELLDWVNLGMVDPANPRHRALMARAMRRQGFPEEELMEDMQDEQVAQQENELLKLAQPVDVGYYENHALHLRIHNLFRKSMEYKNSQQEIRQTFDMHCMMHEQYQAQGQGQAAFESFAPPAGAAGPASPEEAAAGAIGRHVRGSARGPAVGESPRANDLMAATDAAYGGGPGITASGRAPAA